ncbi:hypothetical protein EDC01DRAFT_273066 [Geopyxis carbonaria]|nr:hypothetical protein EDC01DRAFT_273066 [Geopyxis carbonaria]
MGSVSRRPYSALRFSPLSVHTKPQTANTAMTSSSKTPAPECTALGTEGTGTSQSRRTINRGGLRRSLCCFLTSVPRHVCQPNTQPNRVLILNEYSTYAQQQHINLHPTAPIRNVHPPQPSPNHHVHRPQRPIRSRSRRPPAPHHHPRRAPSHGRQLRHHALPRPARARLAGSHQRRGMHRHVDRAARIPRAAELRGLLPHARSPAGRAR